MEDKEQDKTEDATPYKLQRARRKGVVARGVDLGFFAGLTAALAYAWIAGPELGRVVARMARDAWLVGPQMADDRQALLSTIATLISRVAQPLALFAGLVFFVVLLVEILQTGVVFSTDPLSPDFSRLNPANGIQRVFSLRAFIETLKNILKFAIYATIAVLSVRAMLITEIGSVSDGGSALSLLTHSALRLLGAFVLAAALIAVLDQIISRGTFARRMRMTRRELRLEAREREADPRLKQKRKQLHREFIKTTQGLRNIRKADVLIVNPKHLAIGLRYEPRVMTAPKVVAMGADHQARRLKYLAFLYAVPVVEHRALAQMLYRKVALNGTIPDNFFRPVADIYNTIHARKRQREQQQGQPPQQEQVDV